MINVKVLNKYEFSKIIDEFLTLYSECFTAKNNEELIKWNYINNPSKDIVVSVAFIDGKLIGITSAIPTTISRAEFKYKSAITFNLMVHPSYRGKGIFDKIVSNLYEELEKQKFECLIGFPNYISNVKFVEKFDRKVIYEIPTLQVSYNELYIKLKKYKKLNYNYKKDDKFDLNYKKVLKAKNRFEVEKDKYYLKWRFTEHPLNHYKNLAIVNEDSDVKSYLVYKIYGNQINIVDFYFNNNYEYIFLLSLMICDESKSEIDYITTWCNYSMTDHLFFEKMGFKNNYPITYFSGKIIGENIDYKEFYDFRIWNIKMQDNFVY